MDKDEHFKLFDTLACCLYDSLFSSSKYREELSLINSSEVDQEQPESGSRDSQAMKEPNSKQPFLDKKNKNYSELLEDQFYSQEILRENEESKYEYIIQYLSKIFGSEEKYFWRKINLFSNIFSTYYSSIKSINKLSFNFEPLHYKYALMSNFSINALPGMKPSSNWPISLEDLWNKLKSIDLEELFNQPIEESYKENFYKEAIEQIINFDNSNDIPNLTRAICCLLCVLVLFGDFLLLFKGIIFIKTNIKNKDKLDQSILNNQENPLILKLKDLLNCLKDNDFNLYPIMRAYSIVDYFTISKCMIYYYVKSNFSNSCCCCTDGTYIYFYMSGIDGCKLKVGTGYNNTEKGKVYLCIQNLDERGIENDINSNQWVYCNGKIYQKANKVDEFGDYIADNKKEIGNLNVINPETLEVENRIKLLFPQNCIEDSIMHKNQNYVLLSDGKKLSILCLSLNKENEKVKKKVSFKNDNLIYNYINLELINYDIANLNYNEEYEAKINKENRELIEEIYQSFSQIFTKEECFKALLKNNWNPKETALYLIDNPSEIKQSLLIGDKPIVLFQSRIETQNIKSGGRCEFRCYNNTYFDVYNYENYKWCIDENFVISYKLNEGACAIFGREPEKYGKTFNYNIDIKKDKVNLSEMMEFKNKIFDKNRRILFKKDEEGNELLKYVMLKKLQDENPNDIYDELNKDFIEFFDTGSLYKIEDSQSNDNKDGKEKEDKKDKVRDKDKEVLKEENDDEDITDEIYGTFIKKLGALSLDKNYVISYDCIHKVYYLIWSNFTQLNSFYIIISDTFQNMNTELNHLLNYEGEKLSKTINYFESIFSFKENSKIIFDDLTNELLNIVYILTSSMKYDNIWRYKNWSFFYNYLNQFITNRQQELNNSTELNTFLFPIGLKMEISNKTLSKRIDKYDELSKKICFEQLDKELNEEYKLKYIISMENKKKSSMHGSPNVRHIGSWESTSSLMFKYKHYKDKKVKRKSDEEIKNFVLSYENKKIYLTNKRIFFLSFKGDINEINYLLEILKRKKENKNDFDFITLELLFKLIYLWISNIESSLILTNKNEFKNMVKELNEILKEFYSNPERDNEIKKLIRLIILEGWNELNPTLEQQIFWFKDFYNFNKNTEEKEILSENDFNLEYYTLKNYEKYPFYCLLKKLDYSRNSLAINNNFNKINIIKAFNFYPIVYKDKYRLIALPSFHGFSSINMQLPFYWTMFNYNIDYYQRNLKKKIKPIIIENYKGLERYSTAHKGLVVDYKFQKINKIIYDIVKLDNKIVLIEDIINEAGQNISFEKTNKEIMDFFSENCKDNKLINLMNKLIILSFGEVIQLFKKYFSPEPEENNNNNDDSLLSKGKNYLLNPSNNKNNIDLEKEKNEQEENSKKENEENKARKNILKEEYKNSFVTFYQYLIKNMEKYMSLHEKINDNFDLLKLNFSYLYFIFYGIKTNILNNQEENLNLLLSLVKKLNNYEPNSLSLYNELGTVYSNSRVFEYYLNANDIVNINHIISFENNNELYCVELELQIPNNEKVKNKDIIIISNHHGYKNLSFYLTNNIRAYGTSFVVKFNQSFKKILFLKGSEIRIVSPSETFKSQIISSLSNNNKNSGDVNANNKSLLKIKVYPFNNHCISLIKSKHQNYENNIKNLSLSVTNIEEIESYLTFIFKKIIKSTNSSQNESENILSKYDILKLGLKEDFYKKINDQYEPDKNKYTKSNSDENKLDFLQNYLKSNTSLISLKDSNDDSNINLSKKILSFIRKTVPEPIAYINIKKFPSFNAEIKKIWEKMEILILYAFLYHLNLISDYTEVISNNEESFDNVLELILGKRLNTILSFLANKALLYKDGYDLVKNYYYDFEEEYNKLYEEIKQMIIKDIYKAKLIDNNIPLKEKKEDSKETTQTEVEKTKNKKDKKKKKLEKLKEKFGSKDAGNYKKKSNASRI